jgi:hypothetical protein
MAFTYGLIASETEPIQIAPGTFWIIPSQGLLTIYYRDGNFHHIAVGKGNLVLTDGYYFKTVTESSTAPTSPAIGDLWYDTSNYNYWAWLGMWCPVGGA